MTILFQPAPEGTTHFLRYPSGYITWCKVEQGENNQLVLKEWDSFNKFWVPGIHTVEHYQSAGLMSIDDFPTEPASPIPESTPAGATHCYHHAGEVSWYRETADNLFVWRDGSWYASVYKKALDLASACLLGAVSALSDEKRPEQAEDDLTWLARNVCEWKDGCKFVYALRSTQGVFAMWLYDKYSVCQRNTFTRDQWLASRAELQNKPVWKDAPEWARSLAQHSVGRWTWYEEDPSPNDNGFWVDGGVCQCAGEAGEVLGDWRDTLEQRPVDLSEPASTKMMDKAIIEKFMGYVRNMPVSLSTVLSSENLHDLHQLCDSELTKRDAAVCGGQKYLDAHWFELGELPSAGVECTAVADGIPDANCAIVAISTDQVVVRWTENQMFDVLDMPGWSFRPIRTERDELLSLITSNLSGTAGQVADAILAAGFKRDGGEA